MSEINIKRLAVLWQFLELANMGGALVIVCLNGTIFLHFEPKKKFGETPSKCRMSGKKPEKQ